MSLSISFLNLLHGFSAIALVTGRGTGIGKAITRALALNGCDVYIAACKEALLKETMAKFNKAWVGKVEYIVANINVYVLCFLFIHPRLNLSFPSVE